jgi:hypothetical protein
MKTEFEADLSDAFAARAAAVPVGTASRLRSMDYRPRERRLRTPVAVGAGVLASAGTAGAVLSVVLGGAAPAYAGWSAAPTAASAPSPSAATSCQNQLTTMPSGPDGPTLGSGPWENVLTDVRGPFTVALFQNDGAYASCFTSSSFTETNMMSSGGSSGGAIGLDRGSASTGGGPGGSGSGGLSSFSVGGETASGDLTNATQSHLSTASGGPYTLVDGRVATGVTGVTLVLDDGQDVVATVADGWFVAWWPDGTGASSAQVTTASGTTTESLLWPQHGPGGPTVPGTSGVSGSGGNSGSSDSGNS